MNDFEDDIVGEYVRVFRGVSATGMRMLEQMQRRREEARRREAEGQREAAQALRDRQGAQRDAAREYARLGLDSRWRDAASERDLATAFVHAEAYAESDEVCRVAYDAMLGDIAQRHGDVAAFVDEHVDDSVISRVPAPEGQPSASQQRAMERAAAEPDLTERRRQLVVVSIDDDKANEWARRAQEQGRLAADSWLNQNLSPEEAANVERWERWEQAAREQADAERLREEASVERGAGTEASNSHAEALEARADRHEQEADADREVANTDWSLEGLHTAKQLEELEQRDPEAARALRTVQAGRTRPAAELVRNGSGSGATEKKARKRTPDRRAERQNERGR